MQYLSIPAAVVMLLLSGHLQAQFDITYQGQLAHEGVPYNGTANLQFRLYDAAEGGNPMGDPIYRDNWPVSDGLFQVDLDFGLDHLDIVNFIGQRWLEVRVDGTLLLPRQKVTGAPVALRAIRPWTQIDDMLVHSGSVSIGGAWDGATLYIRDQNQEYQFPFLIVVGQDIFPIGVLSNGNVGINYLGGRQQLSVGAYLDLYSGGVNSPTRPSIRASSAGNMIVNAWGDGALFLNHDQGSGGVRIQDGSGGEAARFFSSGNFRIQGEGYKPGGGSWANLSDARMKHNLRSAAPGMLDRLLQLRARHYEYTEQAVADRLALPGVRFGLIAQEVAEVFPDWVDVGEDGWLYLTERNVTAVMVEALREMRREKDEQLARLEAENARLQSELARLRMDMAGRLERLEAQAAIRSDHPDGACYRPDTPRVGQAVSRQRSDG